MPLAFKGLKVQMPLAFKGLKSSNAFGVHKCKVEMHRVQGFKCLRRLKDIYRHLKIYENRAF